MLFSCTVPAPRDEVNWMLPVPTACGVTAAPLVDPTAVLWLSLFTAWSVFDKPLAFAVGAFDGELATAGPAAATAAFKSKTVGSRYETVGCSDLACR
jgi:hypothetical protein